MTLFTDEKLGWDEVNYMHTARGIAGGLDYPPLWGLILHIVALVGSIFMCTIGILQKRIWLVAFSLPPLIINIFIAYKML